MVKEIQLAQGKVALVDDEDYEWLNQWKWYAWWNKYNWYAVRNGNNPKMIFMHRAVMKAQKGQQVDHKNGHSLNNCRDNLRFATNKQNAFNRGKQKNNKSGFKGVYWDSTRNKWAAQIMINGKGTTIGRFNTAIEAAQAYDKQAKELHGEFARTNF